MNKEKGFLIGGPTCPKCGETLDGFTAINEGAEPKDRDITICCYCCELLQFKNNGLGGFSLVLADPEDLLQTDLVDLQRMQEIARLVSRKRKGA